MNQWVRTAAEEMLSLLRKKFGADTRDITAVKQYWHNLNALLFSRLNYGRLYGGKPFCAAALERYGLIPRELAQFEAENRDIWEDSPLFSQAGREGAGDRIAELREQLLCVELSIRPDRVELRPGKAERDNTGSYYTPMELAKQIVRYALSAGQVPIRRGGGLKIADLSCGGGEFFRSAQEVLWEEYQIPPSESCGYFWGVDLDPIALQTSICQLLVHAPEERWPEIISHFRLGNPLLESGQENTAAAKSGLFALGRLYAPEMGIRPGWFPEDGFDLVLGNPPWEKIRLEERKFFLNLCPDIAGIPQKAERAAAIQELRASWPEAHAWYQALSSDYSNMCSAKFRHSLLKHSVSGELNTYALFTELSHRLTGAGGISSLIVKSTLATTPAHRRLWTSLMDCQAVYSLHLFENTGHIFPIDSRERFAVLTLTHRPNHSFHLAAGLRRPEQLLSAAGIPLTAEAVTTINPLSRMIPNVTDTERISVLLTAHRDLPLFETAYPRCRFGRLVHLTAHASQIDKTPAPGNIPIYEGKFIERYDARFSTFAGVPEEKKYAGKSSARKNEGPLGEKPLPESRYFVRRELWDRFAAQYSRPFSLCWRSLTSPTNARTTLAMILPTCPTCQSIQMLQTEDDTELLMLLGLFNSLPFDYFVRLKMPGLDLTQSVIRQIPVPDPAAYERGMVFHGREAAIKTHILSCIYALLRPEALLRPLLDRVRYLVYALPGKSPAELEELLDGLFAAAYGMDGAAFRKIQAEFPACQKKKSKQK